MMSQIRQAIPDFQFANDVYVGAEVSFYTVDAFGAKTATLADLYDAQTGTGTLANPQTLDADGKFAAPVYIGEVVIGEVILANGVADHDTGIIGRQGEYSGSATWDPGSVAAGATTQTTVTVTEAAVGDLAIASFSLPNASMLPHAQVTAAGVVTVTLTNISGAPIDLNSGTVRVRVFHN